MTTFNLGVIGCGFWAQYQLAAWRELPKVTIAAVCDANRDRMKATASRFDIPKGYTDASVMLDSEKFDFIDIITSPESHPELVLLAAQKKVPVICQKPMANDLLTAKKMVDACSAQNTPFYVHENFRWQPAMMRVKELLNSGEIGEPFKSRIYFNTHYPIFKHQPELADKGRMIIADLGVHLFDLVRFFFGEAKLIFCRTRRINEHIKGEDVANSFIETLSGVHCYVELSWATLVEPDYFPQTLVTIEGTKGSVHLSGDCKLEILRSGGSKVEVIPVPSYNWVHPDFAVVQSAMVACNNDLLEAITGNHNSQNQARMNLESLRLVYAAYRSADTGQVVMLNDFHDA